MAVFKCKMCGGTIKFEQGATVGVCDSCGTKQTLPRPDGEKAAKKRKKIIAITASIVVACIAFLIVLTKVIIPSSKYKSAMELYNAEKYEEAITAFRALDGYKDSKEQITKCESAIKDLEYDSAVELYEAGKYKEAITAFQALDGYKDSAAKAKEIRGQYIATARVGDYVVFGSYEQDDNTSNGKEDIEWLVLVKEGNKKLVISRYALDCQEYNTSATDVTWETCSLRKWLNETFINNAFSSDEQNMIQTTTVRADKNPSYKTSPGNKTTDKVFLLSITEINNYISLHIARQCQGTAYCYAQGAYKGSDGNCWWWLRSPGSFSDLTAVVRNDGSVYFSGDDVCKDDSAVRPALWISIGD